MTRSEDLDAAVQELIPGFMFSGYVRDRKRARVEFHFYPRNASGCFNHAAATAAYEAATEAAFIRVCLEAAAWRKWR